MPPPHYNKYLETRRPIATAGDRVATDQLHKSQSQYGGLPELLLAYSCPIDPSEADGRRQPMTCRLLYVE